MKRFVLYTNDGPTTNVLAEIEAKSVSDVAAKLSSDFEQISNATSDRLGLPEAGILKPRWDTEKLEGDDIYVEEVRTVTNAVEFRKRLEELEWVKPLE